MAVPLPALPGPALEALLLAAFRQWVGDGVRGPDPRRYTLPLVCKEWRRCLEGPAGAWDEAYVNDYDTSFKIGESAITAAEDWFTGGRGAAALSLTMDGSPSRSRLYIDGYRRLCLSMSVLRALRTQLQSLSLRVTGGWDPAADLWLSSLPATAARDEVPWPYLKTLQLDISGPNGSGVGDAYTANNASAVLASLSRPPALRRVALAMHCVHLTSLPQKLAQATQLEELEIRFCGCKGAGAGAGPLLLPLPAALETLPLPPSLTVLKLTNSPFIDAHVLAAAQAQCPRLCRLSLDREA